MARVTNREIAYILRLRNGSQRDVRQFTDSVRRASRDVSRSISSIRSAANPFANLNRHGAVAARSARTTAENTARAYRAMADQVRANAQAVVQQHNRLIQSANQLRSTYARPIGGQNVRAYGGGINRHNGARGGGNSGAAQAAQVAAFSGIASAVNDARTAVTSFVSAAALGTLTYQVIQYADAWTNLANRLNALGVPANDVVATQRDIVDIAERARASIDGVGQAYTRMLLASREIGASQAQIARATETVSKAMAVSGATTAESNASIIQLGQALGSGILNGDELRSIRENAPLVAQAIAKEFNTTIGGLKQLGEEGKLVADRVFKALLNASDEVDNMFSKTRATVSQSFALVTNAVREYLGTADQMFGTSLNLAAVLGRFAETIRQNRPLIDGLVTAIGSLVALRFATIVLGWNVALLGLTGPLGLVAAAVAAIGGYVVTNQNTMVRFGDQTVSTGSAVQAVWRQIGAAIGASAQQVDSFMNKLRKANLSDLIRDFTKIGPVEPMRLAGHSAYEAFTRAGRALVRDYLGFDTEAAQRQAALIEEEKQLRKTIDAYRQYGRTRRHSDELTRTLNSAADTKAAEKAYKDWQREINRADDQLIKHIETLRGEQAMLGMVGRERDRIAKLTAYHTQLAAMEHLSDQEKLAFLDIYNQALIRHIQTLREYETAQNGVREAINEYAVSAGNAFENAKNFMSNSLASIEDALTDLMTNGQLDWRKFITAMIADFMRLMVIRPLLANLAKSFGFGETAIGSGTSPADLISIVKQAVGGGLQQGANHNSVTRAPLPPIDMASMRVAQAHAFSTNNLIAAAKAIRVIESGSAAGDYGALGNLTKTGDRAYGAYQVMGNNIPSWSRDAIGRSVSIQEFLKNPQIQDQIFQHRFGGYMDKYGPTGASQAWFAGEAGMKKMGAMDVNGMSVGGYGGKFGSLYKAFAGLDTQAINNGVQQLNQSMQQFGTNAQTLGQNLSQAVVPQVQQFSQNLSQAVPRWRWLAPVSTRSAAS